MDQHQDYLGLVKLQENVAQLEGIVATEIYVCPSEPALARTTAIKYPFNSARIGALSKKPTLTMG